MKRIFRSIINIPKKDGVTPTIPLEELTKNYKSFLASKLSYEEPSYITMYTWIESHFRSYRELPSWQLLCERAQADGNEAILANLKEIASEQPYWRSDYLAIIKEKKEEQNKTEFQALVQKTWTVASAGMKLNKNKEIKGIPQAISFFAGESRKFRFNSTGIKTDSQIRSQEDANEVIESHRKKKRDPSLANSGLFTFLDPIDGVFRGTKLGELTLVAAFVGQGKSTFVGNLAYNGLWQGLNGLYISLEMSFDEMRNFMYCLHTSNHQWYRHPRFKNLAGKISYERICYGELDELEEEFFDTASLDFATNEDYGEMLLTQPEEALTPALLEMEMYERQAQLAERGKNLDFVVVDYVGLMVQDKKDRYGDFNVDLNNMIKWLKNQTLTFNNGRGLRIITPFQINREGWKEAVKNDGVYRLTALSNAHEAERSPDQIYALYSTDEMRKSGIIKISWLKNRKTGKSFQPFEASFDGMSKRIQNFITKKSDLIEDDMAIQEIPTDIG